MPQRKNGSRTQKTSARSTAGGPSAHAAQAPDGDAAAARAAATDELAQQFRFNAAKPGEFGAGPAPQGAAAQPEQLSVTASTLTENAASPKLGEGVPMIGVNPGQGPLDRVRTDATGRTLTTDQGVPIADNQNSLKAGLRGPTLLEDFILREKITHFDHERIPERVVHARGSGAHGFFECYESLADLTRASLFAEPRKRTPVFVRFSTVVGERGSPDTARDVRGFAVKFYTDEGNWDLVGNNIPVFFIQDAMKFPDLVHSIKPEPHHAMPQASSAHDTFWDFVSLMPESTHMLVWLMSDRAIPRSYRTMEGFGVHSFRLVNARGESNFVKFHWKPVAGTHSLVWDEAMRISGFDPDFHRRDLWEAIEAGEFPQWELGIQVFSEQQAERFSFDILDATKIVPEELVPVRLVGRLTLNRNPDNFFAETEQVAFCAAHVVPGIDFSNDPLLAGRIHSYVDTQITRLGGPNFHEIPVNSPVAEVHNNQRDGFHRQAIHRGRVAYEPNSLGGGCPFQAGVKGFTSFPAGLAEAPKLRGKPEKFADHYTQATLFYASQSPAERRHIANAFRLELAKVQVPAIRERVVSMLANASRELAECIARDLGIGMPEPMPRALETAPRPEVEVSPALSLLARPGATGVRTRRVAILVAEGSDTAVAAQVHAALLAQGAIPRIVGPTLATLASAAAAASAAGDRGRGNGSRKHPAAGDDDALAVELSFETAPSVLFDGVVIPGGAGIERLKRLAHALEFVREQYRHCKPLLLLGEARTLLDAAGVPRALPDGEQDPALLLVENDRTLEAHLVAFTQALSGHRDFAREMDPPPV
jgi:catalase